ncbi:MAG: hypothetical protein IIA83_09200 [Thaumarchaeota archaeon]|nr:hypothetical protein [Nitrososphaerota archaeon]
MTKQRVLSSNNMIQENQPTPVKNLDEMKRIVYDMSQKNLNIKDIVKKKFCINGQIIGLNPAKIRQIKEEFENPENSKKEPNHVKLFKLFQKDYTPTAALIETGCTYEEVRETHQQFLSFEDKIDMPRDFMEKMYELAIDTAGDAEVSKDDTVIFYLSEAVKDALKYREFTYPCKYCGLPITISDSTWPSAREFLIKNGWHHVECP